MDENCFVNNAFDGRDSTVNVNDIVRVLLDEQRHTLSEEDQNILRKHDILKNEFHTLENAEPMEVGEHQFPACWNWNDDTSTPNKPDLHFVDIEKIQLSPVCLENAEANNIYIDNTIANFIEDESIKKEVLSINEQLEVNSTKYRLLSIEAQNLFVENQNLKRHLAEVENKIVNYSTADAKIKRLKRWKGADSADTGHQKRTFFCRFGVPYFKSKERFPAYRNSDLSELIRTNQTMMIRLPRVKRFLQTDADWLSDNILKQLKAKRIDRLRKRLSEVTMQKRVQPANEELVNEIRCIEKTIKETENVKKVSETKDWNIPIDFMALPASRRFNFEDFERIWRLTGCTSLSKEEFSENELVQLKSLAEKYNSQNWDRIASEMSTNRSAFQCFTKYAATVKKGKHLPWTKEENELLFNLCTGLDFITKSDNRYQWWRNIRRHFPHRSYAQIHAHWTYVLEPRLKKGRFTVDEHRFMESLRRQGKSYREIALIVQNRSCVQIRTHFEDQPVTKGSWTVDEEQLLLRLIEKYGRDWVKISKELGTRNRSQCRLKYMTFVRNNCRFSTGKRCQKLFWTVEENERFKMLLKKYGLNAEKISKELPGKTTEQIRHKFHRSKRLPEYSDVMRGLRCGRQSTWTDEETESFKRLVAEHGTAFKKIGQHMPGKTVAHLRCKFKELRKTRILAAAPRVTPKTKAAASDGCRKCPQNGDPMRNSKRDRRKSRWTDAETESFKQLLAQYGTEFRKISQLLPGKTAVQLQRKFHLLRRTCSLAAPRVSPKKEDVTAGAGCVNDVRPTGENETDAAAPMPKMWRLLELPAGWLPNSTDPAGCTVYACHVPMLSATAEPAAVCAEDVASATMAALNDASYQLPVRGQPLANKFFANVATVPPHSVDSVRTWPPTSVCQPPQAFEPCAGKRLARPPSAAAANASVSPREQLSNTVEPVTLSATAAPLRTKLKHGVRRSKIVARHQRKPSLSSSDGPCSDARAAAAATVAAHDSVMPSSVVAAATGQTAKRKRTRRKGNTNASRSQCAQQRTDVVDVTSDGMGPAFAPTESAVTTTTRMTTTKRYKRTTTVSRPAKQPSRTSKAAASKLRILLTTKPGEKLTATRVDDKRSSATASTPSATKRKHAATVAVAAPRNENVGQNVLRPSETSSRPREHLKGSFGTSSSRRRHQHLVAANTSSVDSRVSTAGDVESTSTTTRVKAGRPRRRQSKSIAPLGAPEPAGEAADKSVAFIGAREKKAVADRLAVVVNGAAAVGGGGVARKTRNATDGVSNERKQRQQQLRTPRRDVAGDRVPGDKFVTADDATGVESTSRPKKSSSSTRTAKTVPATIRRSLNVRNVSSGVSSSLSSSSSSSTRMTKNVTTAKLKPIESTTSNVDERPAKRMRKPKKIFNL